MVNLNILLIKYIKQNYLVESRTRYYLNARITGEPLGHAENVKLNTCIEYMNTNIVKHTHTRYLPTASDCIIDN